MIINDRKVCIRDGTWYDCEVCREEYFSQRAKSYNCAHRAVIHQQISLDKSMKNTRDLTALTEDNGRGVMNWLHYGP